jgi:hypothetical protein
LGEVKGPGLLDQGHGLESPVCLVSYAKPTLMDTQEFLGLF